MRVLLAECVPRPLRRALPGHKVRTVVEMGWTGKRNGDLLALMEPAQVEVLVTTDQNIRYQQNLRTLRVAVVVLVAPRNRLADLLPLMPAVRRALRNIQPGELIEVSAESGPSL